MSQTIKTEQKNAVYTWIFRIKKLKLSQYMYVKQLKSEAWTFVPKQLVPSQYNQFVLEA
jgi:hypothetical protein